MQNVLWRSKNLPLPSSLLHVIILCRSNNLNIDTTRDIAEGIISIGMCLKDRLKMLKIIVYILELPTQNHGETTPGVCI